MVVRFWPETSIETPAGSLNFAWFYTFRVQSAARYTPPV